MFTRPQTIENYKLLRVIEDIEALDPGTNAVLSEDAIIERLSPVVSKALSRGCSGRSIVTTLAGYGLQLDSRKLGINGPY